MTDEHQARSDIDGAPLGLPDQVPCTRALRRLVRQRRQNRGMSRPALAHAARVSHMFVRTVETRPQSFVDGGSLGAVLRVLGISEMPEEEPEEPELWWKHPRPKFPMPRRLAQEFKRLRERAGLTLNRLAEETATCSYSMVRQLEHRAGGLASTDRVIAVASALKVSYASLGGQVLRAHGFEWIGPPLSEEDLAAPTFASLLSRRRSKWSDADWEAIGLGRENDVAIARRLGTSTAVVWRAREVRGIPPFKGPRRTPTLTAKRLEKAILKNLGEPPRDEAGAIDWTVVPFGQVPDTLLGRWLGMPKRTVARQRERFGLEPYALTSLVDWGRLPLGRVPDTHVAAMTGLSTACIVRARKLRGLPAAVNENRSRRLPPPLPVTQFVIPVIPVKHRTLLPPTGSTRTLWDVADEAMRFLEAAEEVRVDDLLVACGVRCRKATRRQAETLLRDLQWVESDEGLWSSPHAVRSKSRELESSDSVLLEAHVLTRMEKGVHTVGALSSEMGCPSTRMSGILRKLVNAGIVRRIPGSSAALYLINPTFSEGRTPQP